MALYAFLHSPYDFGQVVVTAANAGGRCRYHGMIDIVKYPTRSASEITAQQYRQGRERLLRALQQYRPRLVCYNGKTIYAKLTGVKKVEYGLQPHSAAEGVADFVAVSSSPANAVPYAEKLQC